MLPNMDHPPRAATILDVLCLGLLAAALFVALAGRGLLLPAFGAFVLPSSSLLFSSAALLVIRHVAYPRPRSSRRFRRAGRNPRIPMPRPRSLLRIRGNAADGVPSCLLRRRHSRRLEDGWLHPLHRPARQPSSAVRRRLVWRLLSMVTSGISSSDASATSRSFQRCRC